MDVLKRLEGWLLSGMLIIISVLLTRLIIKIEVLNKSVVDLTKTNAVKTVACKMTHDGVTARLNSHAEDIKELKSELKTHKHK